MTLKDDELKYKNVINTLKSLPKVNAPNNFETELMRRINSAPLGGVKEKQSFWERLFLPSRLVPAAALAVSAVILLFVLDINSDEIENPLLMEPKIREDVIRAENISDVNLPDEDRISVEKEKSSAETNISEFRVQSPDTGLNENNRGFSYAIDKRGLNFRQVNLTTEEKQRLNELKEHFLTLLKDPGNN
jgi:hypothetical protein